MIYQKTPMLPDCSGHVVLQSKSAGSTMLAHVLCTSSLCLSRVTQFTTWLLHNHELRAGSTGTPPNLLLHLTLNHFTGESIITFENGNAAGEVVCIVIVHELHQFFVVVRRFASGVRLRRHGADVLPFRIVDTATLAPEDSIELVPLTSATLVRLKHDMEIHDDGHGGTVCEVFSTAVLIQQ